MAIMSDTVECKKCEGAGWMVECTECNGNGRVPVFNPTPVDARPCMDCEGSGWSKWNCKAPCPGCDGTGADPDSLRYQVKIVHCSDDNYWYHNFIGSVLEITSFNTLGNVIIEHRHIPIGIADDTGHADKYLIYSGDFIVLDKAEAIRIVRSTESLIAVRYHTVTPTQVEEPTVETPTYYDNSKGSLYKIAQDRGWSPYTFDVVKRLDRGGKKDPLRQEIEKSIVLLNLWLDELDD